MQFSVLVSAALATLAAGAALPNAVEERQAIPIPGTGTVRCYPSIPGALRTDIINGIPQIRSKANAAGKICQVSTSNCDRIAQFGTAGFAVCSIVSAGSAPTCWDVDFVVKKFESIVATCPDSTPGTIFGQYSVAASEHPTAATLWGRFDIQKI